MASQSRNMKRDNFLVRYIRETRAELEKVRWPTLEQGWVMTKLVLVVTFGMAIFLGALDFFFGWMMGYIISGNELFLVLGIIVLLALLGAAYLIGRGEEEV